MCMCVCSSFKKKKRLIPFWHLQSCYDGCLLMAESTFVMFTSPLFIARTCLASVNDEKGPVSLCELSGFGLGRATLGKENYLVN